MSTEPVCILGVDPGLTGAIAFYFPEASSRIAVEDMPVAGGEVDTGSLRRRILTMAPVAAMIEHVHAMPKNGSIASFKLGMVYGATCAAIEACGIPMHRSRPVDWKRYHRIPGKTKGGDELARALAIRLFPASGDRFERVKDHNRADAALIARFAAETLGSHQIGPWREAA